jgi:Lon protease-like protein
MSAVLQIPIFPLPDVVLFPHTMLPLHVFEPRYRKMVQDCLAGDKRLAMGLLKAGWEKDYYERPPVHAIAGAGEIIQHEELADGRFNILVRGTTRIGVSVELPPDLPYRVVRARPLPDRYPDGAPDALRLRIDRLKVFYLRILAEVQKGQGEMAKIFSGVKDPGIIVDRIAGAVIAETEARQQILECVDVPTRVSLVQDHLVGILARLSDRNTRSERGTGREN